MMRFILQSLGKHAKLYYTPSYTQPLLPLNSGRICIQEMLPPLCIIIIIIRRGIISTRICDIASILIY